MSHATRLVLVEGFPGSGKSATAQWLARQLRRSGRPATWVYEDERPHPVLGDVPARYASWKAYFADRLGRWVTLAAEARASGGVVILDGAWLQVPLVTMLRRSLDPSVAAAFVLKTLEAVRSLDPVLVFLSPPDLDGALHELWDRRGMRWALGHVTRLETSPFAAARDVKGFPGLLRYWREHHELATAIVQRAELAWRLVNGDAEAARAAVASALDFTPLSEPAWAASQLVRYVGRYDGEDREFGLSLRDGGLVLDGLLWPENRVLPVARNVLEPESWPFTFTSVEADGRVAGLRLAGPAIGQARYDGVYRRTG